MCEHDIETLMEFYFNFNNELSVENSIYCLCTRVYLKNVLKQMKELNSGSDSESQLAYTMIESTPLANIPNQYMDNDNADAGSCYCSASHTDNISTDEHDSVKDQCVLYPSDSGTDLTEQYAKYDNWDQYWAQNGERLVWASWLDKYGNFINPEYLDKFGNSVDEIKPDVMSDICETNEEIEDDQNYQTNQNIKHSKSIEMQPLISKADEVNSSMVEQTERDSNQVDITVESPSTAGEGSVDHRLEGWSPLSEGRCGSAATTTTDSMTHVTQLSPTDSTSSSTGDDAWQLLWAQHFEQQYWAHYSTYMATEQESTLIPADTEELEDQLNETVNKEYAKWGLPTQFGKKRRRKRTRSHNVGDLFSSVGLAWRDEDNSTVMTDVIFNKNNSHFEDFNPKPRDDHVTSIIDKVTSFLETQTINNPIHDTELDTEIKPKLNLIKSESVKKDDGEMTDDTIQDESNKVIKQKEKRKRRKAKRSLPKEVAENSILLKYWFRRFSLFSKFDKGIKLDYESWFSVTPEKVAAHIAKRCQCETIIDAFCGAGGNTIQFALKCERVIAIDIDPTKIQLAINNARIYGVLDKIDFIIADFNTIVSGLKADAVFLSPPWGGPTYTQADVYDAETMLQPLPASQLLEKARQITKNVAMFLPRTTDSNQLVKLAGPGNSVEIEQNYLDEKNVALTVYYGNLIRE